MCLLVPIWLVFSFFSLCPWLLFLSLLLFSFLLFFDSVSDLLLPVFLLAQLLIWKNLLMLLNTPTNTIIFCTIVSTRSKMILFSAVVVYFLLGFAMQKNQLKPVRFKWVFLAPHVASAFRDRGYSPGDIITCECCYKREAVDVAHVYWRLGENYIDPAYLILLCRRCHTSFDIWHLRSRDAMAKRVELVRSRRKEICALQQWEKPR